MVCPTETWPAKFGLSCGRTETLMSPISPSRSSSTGSSPKRTQYSIRKEVTVGSVKIWPGPSPIIGSTPPITPTWPGTKFRSGHQYNFVLFVFFVKRSPPLVWPKWPATKWHTKSKWFSGRTYSWPFMYCDLFCYMALLHGPPSDWLKFHNSQSEAYILMVFSANSR